VAEPLVLIAYSDYLCPWCFNAAVRLRRLEEEAAGAVRVEWKSFLLRPRPEPRTLEAFRAYTRTWRRPAAEPDGGTFREWATDEGPPSHSVPPHLAAKAARTLGEPAFARLHERLLHAYFTENRDITARGTLLALWTDVGLPSTEFDRIDDPALLRAVMEDHDEAVRYGATGVPSVRAEGRDTVVMGAHPIEVYRRWVERLRSGDV
jgi:predicted DsbA family dithiol-disulfide isomerase